MVKSVRTSLTRILMHSQVVVIPAKAGIQSVCNLLKFLDSRFRGNDEKTTVALFCETINIESIKILNEIFN